MVWKFSVFATILLIVSFHQSNVAANSNEFLLLVENGDYTRLNLPSKSIESLSQLNQYANVSAFDYDPQRKCLFQSNYTHISRNCHNDNETDILLAFWAIDNVETLAYDWLSQLLYFVDSHGRIQAMVTTKSHDRFFVRHTIADVGRAQRVRGLVVHPRLGILFWTEQSTQSSVHRSNLDGTDALTLTSRRDFISEPNDLALDVLIGRVYWIDSGLAHVASCDLSGHNLRIDFRFQSQTNSRYQLAVNRDVVYWTRPADQAHGRNSLIAHDLRTKKSITLRTSNTPYSDLHIYTNDYLSGSNACSNITNHCHSMCVSMPAGSHSCVCPDGMFMTYNGFCACFGGDALRCFLLSVVCDGDDFRCDNDGSCIAR